MPRIYKTKPGQKQYKTYSQESLKEAMKAIEDGMSLRQAEKVFQISKSVLHRKLTNPNLKHIGGQPILGFETEEILVSRIKKCAEWGFPLDAIDIRMIVKGYLDRKGTKILKFKNNLPGREWMVSFLNRNKKDLAQRMCQNIKRGRASVSPAIINEYFDNLQESLAEVPPAIIINYDETNLADDPGRKKIITKRGIKYPERIMNQSKSAISIMYAGCADGTLLPAYVVYKALNLYDTWTIGGPPKTRYNRSKSGWFDMICFSDWFKHIILPYVKKLQGKKVLMGDNLSSHLSEEVIGECEKHEIAFIFLPPNSTHLCQPLDVCFFRPMKMAWKPILEKWKKGPGRNQSAIPKDVFPSLLKTLTETINVKAGDNLKSGFSKCGIVPLNRQKVLERLPRVTQQNTDKEPGTTLDETFRDLLQTMRFGNESQTVRKRKKKIDVQPGKSVTGKDYDEEQDEKTGSSETDDSNSNDSEAEIQNAENSSDEEEDHESEIEKNYKNATDDNEIPSEEHGAHGEEPDKDKEEYTGVKRVPFTEIEVNMWVVVDFTQNSGKNRKLFLGRIDQVLYSEECYGTFLRPAKYGNGSLFVFPQIEDKCCFNYRQIIGCTDGPTVLRRGVLKFKVDSRKW